MAIYAVNVPVTSYLEHALVSYHFLTYCAQYPLLYVSGANFAASTVLESSTGQTNAAAPSRFYCTAALFTPAHVGNYLAIRDTTNPQNTAIVVITAYVSATEVQCNAPVANFTVSATGLSFRMFDLATVPAADDFFVITNLVGAYPNWQLAYYADLATLSPAYEMMPIGGYDTALEAATGPTTGMSIFQYSVIAQAFFAADPAQGWALLWNEETGGVGSNRNAVWFGTVGSTHAATATGFPADATYAGIMGSTAAGTADNLSRVPGAGTVSAGFAGDADGTTVLTMQAMNRRTIAAAVDPLTLASTVTNGRTGQSNDFDVTLFNPSVSAVRGYQTGMRHCNDNIPNRTLLSGGNTYVLGDGIAVAWNGKPVV